MADLYTVTTKSNIFSRLFSSIIGVFIGILLFIGSFFILWWNEGRVDVSKIAAKAVRVESSLQNDENNDKLIAVTGTVTSDESLVPDTYVNPGNYLILLRRTEMYSWVEDEDRNSEKSIGGSEMTTTTYSYVTEWKANPHDSTNFKQPEGHANPPKSVENSDERVSSANIGVYKLLLKEITASNLPIVTLSEATVVIPENGTITSDGYLYLGTGSYNTPSVGDVRMRYFALTPTDSVTVFGKQHNDTITSFTGTKNTKLHRLSPGSFESAIEAMHTEYTFMLWIFRIIGFVLMWIGLSKIFAPISVFLDILPIAGSLSRSMIGLITFLVSLVLSVITIIIGIIFHNIILLIATIAIIAAGVYTYSRFKKKNTLSTQQNMPTEPAQPINPSLLQYVKSSRAQGVEDNAIQTALLQRGWKADDIQRAFTSR